jgi:acid stress-induced BolA-like protein IbaG/YrbA
VSDHPTDFKGSVSDAIAKAITGTIANATVEVSGGGGHYAIVVTSSAFAGKGTLESQRMVYGAITHLMKGDMAPVHAVDSLKTKVA